MAGSDQPKRKRNVVSRDRLGCISCRSRRLRCDKTKPECLNCTRTNRKCEGYVNPICFRDQTNATVQKARDQAAKRKQARSQLMDGSPSQPSPRGSPRFSSLSCIAQLDSITHDIDQGQASTDPVLANAPTPSMPDAGLDFALLSHSDNVDWALDWQNWELKSNSAEPVENISDYNCIPSPESPFFNNKLEQATSQTYRDDQTTEMDLETFHNLMNPALSLCLSDYSHPAFAAFQFSPDHEYYRYLCNGSVEGFNTIMPLVELISDDRLASSYLYSAALAVSALSVSLINATAEPLSDSLCLTGVPKAVAKRHALQHYSTALKSLSRAFPMSGPDVFSEVTLEQLLGWLMTRLLLSNIDLRLGSLAAWRAHLRVVGRVISVWHSRISQSKQGRALIHTFARMALLLELQNEDFAVTRQGTMNPCIAAEIASMLEHSTSPRDRLLALIRDVSKVEVKYRLRPDKSLKWVSKMENIEAELLEWYQKLSPTELPVDTGIAAPVSYTVDDGIYLTPLTFPNSTDPHTAAVNYAHFLCARMRSRTRYGSTSELIAPDDAETSILYICRIAAGLDPSNCKQVDAYGHGMMPAVVGAFRWSLDERIRNWIVGWLKGYGGFGAREGLWNVDQTRRLMLWIDENYKGVAYKEWHLIMARIVEEDSDGSNAIMNEEMVWHEVVQRAEEDQSTAATGEQGDGASPFRVVMYTRSQHGPATHYFTVP